MSDPGGTTGGTTGGDREKLSVSFGPAVLARLRTAATLVVLGLLVVVSVRVGFSQVAEPFPEIGPPPVCTDVALDDGEQVRPEAVTVSVINAGGPNGLASRTLGDLVERGFGRGDLADAPDDAGRVLRAQIWTTEGVTAEVKLLRSHVQGKVTIVDRAGPEAGLNLLVGPQFEQVVDGRTRVRAGAGESTCVPAVSETPAPVS